VKVREFPGAVALGLLASLGAHTVLYGGSHEMGGAYHEEIVTMALAAIGGFLLAFGALAWTGARHSADGSVLAARLLQRLPGLVPVLIATALCYGAGERLEPQHAAASLLPLVAAIVAAAWLFLTAARGAIKTLAQAVVIFSTPGYAVRKPIWLRRAVPVFAVAPAPSLRRRYARPPPPANAARA
jgi:hypothetical protein